MELPLLFSGRILLVFILFFTFLFAFVFSLTLLFIQAFFHQADVQNQNRERHIQNIRLKVDLQTVGNTAPQLDNETKMLTDRVDALFTSALATAQSTEQEVKDSIEKLFEQIEAQKSHIEAMKSKFL